MMPALLTRMSRRPKRVESRRHQRAARRPRAPRRRGARPPRRRAAPPPRPPLPRLARLPEVVRGDPRALTREGQRDGAAEAAARAGDERDLAGEPPARHQARGRRLAAALEPEAREVHRLRPPHVLLAEDELDEPLDHAHARGPADDLGMAEPVEEAALRVHALELLGPDLPHVLLAPDAVAHRRHRAAQEERRVVVAPRGGELHQGAVRASRGSRAGRCRAHCCDRRSRAASSSSMVCWLGSAEGVREPSGIDAQDLLEDVEALHEQRFLLLAALHEEGLLVEIAVVAHLVAALHDLLAEGGVALDDPARDEDAGLDPVAVEQLEDARHARLGPVGAHRHVQRPLGQRGVAVDPRALAVEVERHHDGAARAVGPGHRLRHRVLRASPYRVSCRSPRIIQGRAAPQPVAGRGLDVAGRLRHSCSSRAEEAGHVET